MVVVGDGDMAAAKRRLIERAGGICIGEPDANLAKLAFVALEDRRAAEAAALRLKDSNLLVNVADRPELCDFTLPSVLERGDVLVAVGTGGASAGLAKHLRLRLEALLPSSLGALADALKSARAAMRDRWPDAALRRRVLDEALSEGGMLDPLDPAAAGRLEPWLADAGTRADPELVEILLVSHDPDDLTLRQARLLGMADTIRHDPQVSPSILARARADAAREAVTGDVYLRPGLTVVLRQAEPR